MRATPTVSWERATVFGEVLPRDDEDEKKSLDSLHGGRYIIGLVAGPLVSRRATWSGS